MNNFGEKVSFIWSVADLIRGPYRPNQYKDVMHVSAVSVQISKNNLLSAGGIPWPIIFEIWCSKAEG